MSVTASTAAQELLLAHFDMIAGAPGGVARLRQLILQLAVQGRLVEQKSEDEPASTLLARARAKKTRLVASSKRQAASGVNDLPASLPPTWAWTTLAELGLVNPRNDVSDDQEVAFVPMTLVPQNYGEPVQSEVRLWKDAKKGFTHFAEGDVVLAKITPCFQNGKAAVMRGLRNGVGAGTTELHVFRPIAETVLPEYVYIYLKSPTFVSEGIPRMTGTAGQKRVPGDYFAQNPFPLPPLSEQRRIVERVDALMALCDALEERQAREDEERRRLLRALINTLLSARDASEVAAAWARLSDSFDLVLAAPEDVAPLRQAVLQLAVQGRLVEQDPEDEPASVLLERIRAEKARLVREGKLKKVEPLPQLDPRELPYELPKNWLWARFGDVTVCRDGERIPVEKAVRAKRQGRYNYYGASGVIDKIDGFLFDKPLLLIGEDGANLVNRSTPIAFIASGEYWVNNHAHVLDSYSLDCLRYLELFINAIDLKPYVTGTAQPKMNQAKMNSIPVAWPPLAEQRRIVARVEQLMGLCDMLEARLREERAAAERLAEALCAAVAAGQPVEQPQVPATVQIPAEDSRILELPGRVRVLDLDAYTIFAARVIQQHQGTPTARTLGHVKLEKTAHLAEPYGGVDLGRRPQAMPRGPADFDLLTQVIDRGRELNAFDAPARAGSAWGYQFVALPELDALAGRFHEVFGAQAARLDQLITLLVPLKSRQAEAVATLYAVWNDLIRTGTQPDDEQIFAAFRAFHPRKERFRPEVLDRWLKWMRTHGVTPDGSGKPTLPASQRHAPAMGEVDMPATAAETRLARRAAKRPTTPSNGDGYTAAAALLAERGSVTNGDVQAALGVDAQSARALLKRLVAEGLARKEGERRGARYVWTGRQCDTVT